MSKDMIDLFALCYKLVRDGKFEDIAIYGATCFSSIKSFNTVNDMYEYAQNKCATELLFRKNGRNKFTERVYLHQIRGFKLNEKSVTFMLSVIVKNGSRESNNYNIKF